MNSRQNFIFHHFTEILKNYNGKLPFHHYFKNYSIANKSLGSKDRKILKEIIYSTFRSGAYKLKDYEQIFLASNHKNNSQFLNDFYKDLPADLIKTEFLYPFKSLLNKDFESDEYYISFAIKPLVWLRISRNDIGFFSRIYADDIIEVIDLNENFISLGLKADVKIKSDTPHFEIQDLSSQIASSIIKIDVDNNVWDCCSGAGGKSLFVFENFKEIKLYASDRRKTILENLKSRFKNKKLKIPETAELDLEKSYNVLNYNGEKIYYDFFDTIIADVPCSGSGTWAREPENLYFFAEEKIKEFTLKQYNITSNALKFLKPQGKLYYITCSVFDEENSKIIEKISNENEIEVLQMEYIIGYKHRADNMFVAEILKK